MISIKILPTIVKISMKKKFWCEDTDGNLVVENGDVICDGRGHEYFVHGVIGYGAFSEVVEVENSVDKFALKIFRKGPKYSLLAKNEIETLKKVCFFHSG